MSTNRDRRITERAAKALGHDVQLATPVTSMPTMLTVAIPLLAAIALIVVIRDSSAGVLFALLGVMTVCGLLVGNGQRLFVVAAGEASLYRVKMLVVLTPKKLDRVVDPRTLVIESNPRGLNYRTLIDGKKYLIKRQFLAPYAAYVQSVD